MNSTSLHINTFAFHLADKPPFTRFYTPEKYQSPFRGQWGKAVGIAFKMIISKQVKIPRETKPMLPLEGKRVYLEGCVGVLGSCTR
ncbi:hypothetical protein CDAR_193461 [Caerostris darwini]|uniref:Uncharacterized protein n=1 Tax=Caerostris darwini TaxID=1538125 RepID=A0AAV4RS43_9ARAC|nr:hypothetical protein CDAR_193461 [Caerostris darwini]